MEYKLIVALAEVLAVDLVDLRNMSRTQKLAHLEAMQSTAVLSV